MNYRSRKQPINGGRPGLVCMPTGKTVVINGRVYRILKLAYDLKGEYVKPAMIIPR